MTHRWQPTRLPRPWDSPGKNPGVGCHFLLQWMKVKRESEVAQSCLTLSDPLDCSPPGSSIHGIFQARVLEWGAIAFSSPFFVVSNTGFWSFTDHFDWNFRKCRRELPMYTQIAIFSRGQSDSFRKKLSEKWKVSWRAQISRRIVGWLLEYCN